MVSDVPILFSEGKPTDSNRELSPQQAHDLDRLGNLRLSDWYFNRALFRLLLGVDYLHKYVEKRVRDEHYYAKASLKVIEKWRLVAKVNSDTSLEDRGLAPTIPSPDQKILLNVRTAMTQSEIHTAMIQLLPIYAANAASPMSLV